MKDPVPGRAPILLCNAGYYGTLAAVRSLGRAGVPVITADPSWLAPGRYSRFSSSHLSSPTYHCTEAWTRWLLASRVGERRPVIYATSDIISYVLAGARDALAERYLLYQPPLETMLSILDKGRLYAQARAVGVETPDTWLPGSRDDAASLAAGIEGPLLVKPRSQLAVRSQTKGTLAEPGSDAVLAAFDGVVADRAGTTAFAVRHPEAMVPMLQRYHSEAREEIYSLSGFRDASGRHTVMLGARKVFQRPRRLGIGLCFEDAPVDPVLAAKVHRLFDRVGYYGAFEVEFIDVGGRPLLIDVNARFYNQMVFDMARGVDLPGLCYAGATGDEGEVARLVAAARSGETRKDMAFCNSFGLRMAIGAQRAFGTMSREEAARWRRWRRVPGRKIVDAVRDRGDPLPAAVDAAQQLLQYLRHPRAFVRQQGFAR